MQTPIARTPAMNFIEEPQYISQSFCLYQPNCSAEQDDQEPNCLPKIRENDSLPHQSFAPYVNCQLPRWWYSQLVKHIPPDHIHSLDMIFTFFVVVVYRIFNYLPLLAMVN
jgi:hypothetical protein